MVAGASVVDTGPMPEILFVPTRSFDGTFSVGDVVGLSDGAAFFLLRDDHGIAAATVDRLLAGARRLALGL